MGGQYQTNKSILLKANLSAIFLTGILIATILMQPTLNVLPESFNCHLDSISIAISRLSYDQKGMEGLSDVRKTLNEIPYTGRINYSDHGSHLQDINSILYKAAQLRSFDPTQLHATQNDVTPAYFHVVAFKLFGIKIQSLSYLWMSLFSLSVLIFLIIHSRNLLALIALNCIIAALSIIVLTALGAGIQLMAIYNSRFLPILGLVPLTAIIFWKERAWKAYHWALILTESALLIVPILMRATTLWVLIALTISRLATFFCERRKPASTKTSAAFLRAIKMPILILIGLILAKSAISSSLGDIFKNEEWVNHHTTYHNLLISLTTDPVIYNGYVCSEEPLKDNLMHLRHLQCYTSPRPYPNLAYSLFLPYADMHAYHAVVKYLRDRGSNEQLGKCPSTMQVGRFNIRWERHEEIARKIYFNILSQHPFRFLYVHIIIKPLRYCFEVLKYPFYLARGIKWSSNPLTIMVSLIATLAALFYLVANMQKSKSLREVFFENGKTYIAHLFIVWAASVVPSIVVYTQYHTIPESVAALIALILFAVVTITLSRESEGRKGETVKGKRECLN